jgi:hypothetical protein
MQGANEFYDCTTLGWDTLYVYDETGIDRYIT